MATLSIGQKAVRVLRFLLGMRNPRVAHALAAHGMTESDVDEGWTLLRGASRLRLDAAPPPEMPPAVLVQLDEWENRWFPIAEATLARRLPAVHERMFRNLAQASGADVVITVGTFLERFAALDAPGSEYGADGAAAKKVLEARGLRAEVIDDANKLLTRTAQVEPSAPLPNLEAISAESQAAEEALWGWYLEWSRVARAAIPQRNLLRQLGFLGRAAQGSAAAEQGGEEEEEGEALAVSDGAE